MSASLVGSEMCIRDSTESVNTARCHRCPRTPVRSRTNSARAARLNRCLHKSADKLDEARKGCEPEQKLEDNWRRKRAEG
eukprot:12918827-Alexandrium_andersonii.AAC.1